MSAQKLVWFPFFPADWLSSDDVELMTISEEGGYHRLLCHAWMQPDCGLPDDDLALAKLSRLGRQWKKSGPKLRLKFIARGGRLYNERLLTIHAEQQARSKKASESAQRRFPKDANAMRTHNKNNGTQHCERNARASGSVSASVVEVTVQEQQTADEPPPDSAVPPGNIVVIPDREWQNFQFADWFADVWERWKKRRGSQRQICAQYLGELAVNARFLRDFEYGLVQWCDYWDRRDWNYCTQTLVDWVRDEGWKDAPPAITSGKLSGVQETMLIVERNQLDARKEAS